MKKTIFIILSVLLSLAMILPGTTAVMAESEKEAKPEAVVRAALMIRAPNLAEVGQPVTITVLGKFNHQPVAAAEVYALNTGRIASTADRNNYTTTAADYAGLVDAEGIFLGMTNNEGNVIAKFADDGRYILIAFKAGHFPGFRWISVSLSNVKRLYLKSPGSAEVGKPTTFAVIERSSQQPVAEAAIYGKKIDVITTPAATPSPTIASFFSTISRVLKPKPAPSPVEANATEVAAVKIAEQVENAGDIEKNGILLGYTNEKGELVYTFNETGYFALAAAKKGYAPGFARIKVTLSGQKALGIKVPDKADVNQPVTLTVFEKQTSQIMPGARIYALRIGDVFVAIPAEKPTTTILTSQPTSVALDASVDADTVKTKGTFLGETDNSGQLVHKFDRAGHYVLLAIKDEYSPGFARINIIIAVQKAIGIKVPGRSEAGKPTDIVTYDRNNYQPVPGAAVYALRIGEPDGPIPVPFESLIKPEATSPAQAKKNAADVRMKGIFLGYTNENAHLVYTFEKPGHYLLVAVKETYLPGFARITIISSKIVPGPTNMSTSK